MLKLRKVDLAGFKSFSDKTHITFSGTGITCIVGPNGCGKSNIVDAISWVLGEQSHKLLRAERMSDCIFNGTAKKPAMGMSEVSLTMVDPELAEAAAKVLGEPIAPVAAAGPVAVEKNAPEDAAATDGTQVSVDGFDSTAPAGLDESSGAEVHEGQAGDGSHSEQQEGTATDLQDKKRRRREKQPISMKPGEVVVTRRLYRSGQSEYLINGRVVRLRDIQEMFMTMGLGPDSYSIIEQGRIGQILNSKPMDRRAIIEEAAGITMYKTKRRLAEAKLEASKVNLSRVNDILVEVEKQLASLKRQASKARRYAELREQMRTLLRKVLASKARVLDAEAERLERVLRELSARDEQETQLLHTLDGEQDSLGARTYELDAELRQTQNLLNQSSLELDRAENRIAFNREQAKQIDARTQAASAEIQQAEQHAQQLYTRMMAHRDGVSVLREQAHALESVLRESAERVAGGAGEQRQMEARIEELRRIAARMGEDAARSQTQAVQAEETVAKTRAAEEQRFAQLRAMESACEAHSERVTAAAADFEQAQQRAEGLGVAVREQQAKLAELRRELQETAQRLEKAREELSGAKARRASLEQILNEHSYTAGAVQKLFASRGSDETKGFRAVGLLADYAEVEAQYETAIEQFLRDELEYVVVETFDHARAGISLLREEMGGRATFFVDSLRSLNIPLTQPANPLAEIAGVIARLDQLVTFREPLGDAAREFIGKLRAAFIVEAAPAAEQLAREYPQMYFLTLDGTCYHGRMVSGGRAGDAGPLALKRELRMHEAEAAHLETIAAATSTDLSRLESDRSNTEQTLAATSAQHMEAEKLLVAARIQREQAQNELRRYEEQLAEGRREIERLQSEAAGAQQRAEQAREENARALETRATAETEATQTIDRLSALRQDLQVHQEQLAARREELATAAERLASAEAIEKQMNEDLRQSRERLKAVQEQRAELEREKAQLVAGNEELLRQIESFRSDKARLETRQAALEQEWEKARNRAAELDDIVRSKRQSLDELRAERGQREIDKARNDSDRDYMRQTCVTELNAQPEELMGLEPELIPGEELVTVEASYNEMKARVEAMGPVNMMALEEYQQCEERDSFLRRERDDLLQSITNTQQAITELDTISRQKFDEAFTAINGNFATAFQTLFGGGTGEMRLTEPDSSGESGIDIVAQPPGKRLQNILLLSGGEKALTALSLLIAVFRYQPSPFCILDEVDAPLDEANVGRFNKMLADMCGDTQFIVVTHNRRTMEMGSVLYGVTMQEPGVSRLVSVKWEEQAASRTVTNAA